jgi:glycosyltransferase involved in cell wall biosynthesis
MGVGVPREKKTIVYLAGGRSVSARAPGRKISSIVECWRAKGHEVHLVCGGDLLGGTPRSAVQPESVRESVKRCSKLGILDPLARSYSEFLDIKHNRNCVPHLRRLCAEIRPDLIWERSSRLHAAGLAVAREMRVPCVLEWIDNLVPYSHSLFRRHALGLERKKNEEAGFLVVESVRLLDDIAGEGIDRDKIIIVYNAVAPQQFKPDELSRKATRDRLGVRKDEVLVGYLGSYAFRLGVRKDEVLVGYLGSYAFYHDPPLLVHAADLLKDRLKGGFRVVMAGNGAQYTQTRLLAEQKGISGSLVTFHSAVPEPEAPSLLAGFDIAVLPGSTDIICPIKVQEYMAMGLAVAVPDHPCNREVIEDGRTGVLFKPGDAASLAGKLEELAGSRKARENMGKAAREEVLRRFTWETTWGAALDQVLERV